MKENIEDHMGAIARRLRIAANRFPWDGTPEKLDVIKEQCSRRDVRTGASLLFTLDYGYHSSGWWKNPDYERCFHLSIASLGSLDIGDARRNPVDVPALTAKTREAWSKAFFRGQTKLLWVEPPYSEIGKKHETFHYRLFVDESGIPLLPRGEVYSMELTEAGWKSWSELHGDEK